MADLLADLNPAQREAVTHPGGPVLVLAGAGSGKTRVLTRRVAFLLEQGVAPHQILAITFTNKAAREMRERVEQLVGTGARDMWIGTFHASCVRILRRDGYRIGYDRNFIILDEDDRRSVLRDVLKERNLSETRYPPNAVGGMISAAKNQLLDPEEFAARHRDFYRQQVAAVYAAYQERLQRNGAMDFDDLLMQAVRLLEEAPDVLAYYQRRFVHILVDEYQDTNHAQYRLLRLLAAGHRNLFVVGDPDQSVYRWRGADITNILRFEEDYPDARVVRLELNYRSTASILGAAQAVIEHNTQRKEKQLRSVHGEGARVVVFGAADEHDEAWFVAREMERLHGEEGYGYGEMAVLYRTHAQSRVLEETLLRRGIPYRIVGGLKFYERKEVKDILAYLRLAVNPDDRISLRRVINVPRRGIGEATLARLEAYLDREGVGLLDALARAEDIPGVTRPQAAALMAFGGVIADLRAMAEQRPAYDVIALALDRTGYKEMLEQEQTPDAMSRLENLKELLSVARDFERQRGAGDAPLVDFLAEVALVSDVDQLDEGARAVSLMTLHSAKGLEFDVVFITGMEEGVFPHSRSLDDPHELEEERRLCYVGMTRARRRLYMCFTRQRTLFGATRRQVPSRFLEEADQRYLEWQGLPPGSDEPAFGDGGDAWEAGAPAWRGAGARWGAAGRPGRGSGAFGWDRGRGGPGGGAGLDGRARGGPAWNGRGASETAGATLRGDGTCGPAAAGGEPFRPGERVVHPRFGEGTIVMRRGEGDDAEVTIAFPDAGLKTFIVRYANLRRA
ncbi:ATP-dependent DNA helicase PcrA [Thermaerobacter marianensis DSM 12885]|uniref:ATP-dependent DNA helicase n=1 Tax=Thermaerobacter marianensis (strain ATCC 700841 / DSM 12885 / JCM 10246 / 7p75a) TaxID=644966 RepID=E6SMF0_THEM7|nr:DNA helicase PcrA [Thermaerobacter marianensis]ADU50410.1 ATP-dependent DNA helicase PcrA [Thermaerobacter marianensis DSM 12885]